MSRPGFENNDARVCLTCHRENSIYAVRCFHCGAPLLASDTLPLSMDDISAARLVEMTHEMATIRHEAFFKGALFLYVLDYSQSVVIIDKQDLILGRNISNDTTTPGDLARYDAYALGVSRHHAMVTYTDGRYSIKDLGSANGTWVNGRRLPPHEPYMLKKGDRIWLGKLVLVAFMA